MTEKNMLYQKIMLVKKQKTLAKINHNQSTFGFSLSLSHLIFCDYSVKFSLLSYFDFPLAQTTNIQVLVVLPRLFLCRESFF